MKVDLFRAAVPTCTSVKPDSIILMDNGSLSLKVEHVGSDQIMCEVMSGVKLGRRKNRNLSGVKVDLFRAADRAP